MTAFSWRPSDIGHYHLATMPDCLHRSHAGPYQEEKRPAYVSPSSPLSPSGPHGAADLPLSYWNVDAARAFDLDPASTSSATNWLAPLSSNSTGRIRPRGKTLVLDTRDLITTGTRRDDRLPASALRTRSYTPDKRDPVLGSVLRIAPSTAGAPEGARATALHCRLPGCSG